jgi:riboflavin synthase
MFTGIIQAVGQVRQLTRRGPDAEIAVESALDLARVAIGDSMAVNGACLTVTGRRGRVFQADVSAETLSRTTLGQLRPGDRVNVEPALRLGDPLGGHIVLGHVDGTGFLTERTAVAASVRLVFSVEERLGRYIVEKGSVAVDGVSLTVNDCGELWFCVNVIPHTARQSTLADRRRGDRTNVETDILARYVEKLLPRGGNRRDRSGGALETLLREATLT